MADTKIQAVVAVDTTQAEGAFARVEQSAGKMASGVKKAGADAAKGLDGLGSGSGAASQKVERDTKSIIGSIQRLTAQYESGEKNSSKYFEAIAKQRGISTDALRPYLAQLDAAKAKQDAASGSLKGFSGVADQAKATILSLGGAMAGAFSVRAFFNAADAVTSLNNQLKLATGSAETAKSAYLGLFEVAQRSRTGFVELGSTFASISRAADGLGLSQQQLLKLTETIGNAITVSGSSAGASSAALVQLSQGLASGVLRGEELNSIMEQTPRLARAIADGLGVPIGKLREMGKAGELSAQAVISALQSQSDVLTGEVQNSVLTVGQAFTQLQNSATGLSGEIDRVTGSTSTMAGIMSSASSSLDDVTRAMRGVEGSGADLAGVVGGGIATVFETVTVLGANVAYTLTQIGKELGGLAAQAVAVAKLDFAVAGDIGRLMREDAARARKEIDALTDRVLNARSVSAKISASLSGVDTRAEDARLARSGVSELLKKETAAVNSAAAANKAKAAIDKEAAAAARELAEARRRDFEVVELRNKAVGEAWKEEQERTQAAIDANADLIESRQLAAQGAQADLEQQKLRNAEYGLEGMALVELQNARLLDAAAALDRKAALAQDVDLSGLLSDAYRAEADALRGLAEARKVGEVKRQQAEDAQEQLRMWEDINSTAESVFMDIAMNGEDAFKRIGESIKREVIQMLYEMTVKKWIFQIAGVSSGGGGGGTDWISLATKAYDYYTGGTTAASAASVASAYGTTAASQQTAMLAAQEAGMAGSSAASGASAIYGYMGYAALIAAAVMVAENLYSKGYNRAALGYGNTSTGQIGQYSSYTSDPNISQSNMQYSPAMLMTTFDRTMMDALGVSEKWADIFSGTVRMATLVGRKLSGYGLEAEIVGGDVSVSGYADYKGGLFRSDKTVDVAVDERDANALKAQVEAMQQGTRAMAQAMGYSTEEIDNYTGSLKLNFKGVESSAEAAERLQKAMDDMQFSMLKAASGSNLSREEFDKFMEGVQASIEAAGISSAGIADILVQGMTGRLSEADVGDQLASTIVGGIYNAIAGQYAAVIAESFMASIITPIFTAITAGVPISQAISQAAIENVVATAQSAAAALNAIFSRADFQSAIAGIEAAIGGVAGAATSINVPSFGTPTSVVSEVNEAEQERYNLETELLTLLGQTTVLRERELAALDESNQSLQLQIWALEDSKDAVDSAMDALTRAIESQREILQEQLTDALDVEQSLNDIFGILKDSIADLRGEVEGASAMSANAGMEAIRAAISGTEIDGETLSDAIDAVRTAIEDTTYETAFERDRAVLSFAGELSTLAGVTEKELSTAEQQVSLLEEQLEALDVQLDTAQQQIDALYGVDTSVKSVEEAVTALTVAMAGYSAAVEAAALVSVSNGAAPEVSSSGGSSGGYSGSSGGSSSAEWTADGYWSKNPDLQAEYERLIGLDPSQSDPQFNKDPSLSYRDEYLKWHWETHGAQDKRKFAKGGAFTNGIVKGPVAFNMGLMGEAGDEAILPLTNVNGRLGVSTSSSRKTDELLQKVLREMESFHFNSISEAKAGNKMLKKWDGDGIPETREVTA
jgi:tape measure domain-containing protein